MEIKAKSDKQVTETEPTASVPQEIVDRVVSRSQEDYFLSERKALTTQIFIALISAKASTGTWDHGTLPDNKTLLRDLNHIKGIAEIAATVITTESAVAPKPAGR